MGNLFSLKAILDRLSLGSPWRRESWRIMPPFFLSEMHMVDTVTWHKMRGRHPWPSDLPQPSCPLHVS